MTKEKVIERETEKDKDFIDDYDIIKEITDIHIEDTGMSKDLILMTGAEQETKEFIMEQLKVAERLRFLIKENKVAQRVHNKIAREVYMIAILNRNNSQNFVVKQILRRGTQEEPPEAKEEEEKKGLLDRLLKREKRTEEEE